jgi:hypothetical protein
MGENTRLWGQFSLAINFQPKIAIFYRLANGPKLGIFTGLQTPGWALL